MNGQLASGLLFPLPKPCVVNVMTQKLGTDNDYAHRTLPF
jgi:hypothetical protein